DAPARANPARQLDRVAADVRPDVDRYHPGLHLAGDEPPHAGVAQAELPRQHGGVAVGRIDEEAIRSDRHTADADVAPAQDVDVPAHPAERRRSCGSIPVIAGTHFGIHKIEYPAAPNESRLNLTRSLAPLHASPSPSPSP